MKKQEPHFVTPLLLQQCLNRTKPAITKLTDTQFRVLLYLITNINNDELEIFGYRSYPSTDTICAFTGYSSATIERVRKDLVPLGWIEYVSGRGPGNCNTYYINAQKIVDCMVESGLDRPKLSIAKNNVVGKKEADKIIEQHKRNTSGLMVGKNQPVVQNQQKEIPVQTPQAVPESYIDYDDPDLPDWAR